MLYCLPARLPRQICLPAHLGAATAPHPTPYTHTWHVVKWDVYHFRKPLRGGCNVWLGFDSDEHVVAPEVDRRGHLHRHASGVVQACRVRGSLG